VLTLVEQSRSQIDELCRAHHVARLELFGSAAREDFDPEASDLDFLVEFRDEGWKGAFKRFMGLKLNLERLFGRQVDLVEAKAIINPYFARAVQQDRVLVYAA
jgi:uncharacterized protein